MRKNDKVPRGHRCRFCNTKLVRKRFGNERLEDWGQFLRRKYCDRSCMVQEFRRRG